MRTAVSLAVCAASGLLLALAFPRAGWWPLAWVALVPWLAVVFTARWPVAVIGSWLAGFSFFSALMSWIAIFGYLPWALLALIQGVIFVAAAALVRIIAPRSAWRVLAVGVAWVTCEFALGLGPFGITWGQIGHSQASFGALAQLAAFGGVPAISFLVVTVNAAVAHALVEREKGLRAYAPLLYAAALVAWAAALGSAHGRLVQRALAADTAPPVRVGIAQPSIRYGLEIGQSGAPETIEQQRRELAAYEQLTRQAAARGARIIIWPESAVPGYLEYESVIRDTITSLARELGVWLLVGGPAYENDCEYNSIYVISPQGLITGRYDKVHLVPFGEYVPWREHLPFLSRYRVRARDVTRGAGHRLLRANGLSFGPLICFESVFPYISRHEAARGAQALVVATNDAWFLRTSAAAQHLQIGRFRAIEEGMYFAQAAGTGVSGFVDPLGRVITSLGIFERGAIVADVRPRAADTLYRRVGPAFSLACVLAAFGWVIGALILRRARRRRG